MALGRAVNHKHRVTDLPTCERAVRFEFLHPGRDIFGSYREFESPLLRHQVSGIDRENEFLEIVREVPVGQRSQLRNLATERANFSRFARLVSMVSQNGSLPVAFFANDVPSTARQKTCR